MTILPDENSNRTSIPRTAARHTDTRCFGIDLGTTYSVISYYEEIDNRVETVDLDSSDGGNLLPSVVYFPEGGQAPVVGQTAQNAGASHPARVIAGIKRSMGTSFQTAPIDGRKYTPQEVSAEILKCLVQDAERYLGEAVRDVVITVPAYFGDNERAATEEAGKLAGLNVLRLLPEPHAAALAFAVQRPQEMADRNILVYDLGGGTFDVTLIHTTLESAADDAPASLRVDTLCKDGNAQLGGMDWDRALGEIVAEKVMSQEGVDLWNDSRIAAELLEKCEKAKRDLSRVSAVQIVVGTHAVEVSRAEFEDRTSSLLLETELLLDNVLEQAESTHGIARGRIDLLLVGGSTYMPMVRKMATLKMDKEPILHKNPNLLVSMGAAYWAHLLSGDATVSVMVSGPNGKKNKTDLQVPTEGMGDQSTYSVGVEALRPDGKGGFESFNSVILESGSKYGGQKKEKVYGTSEDNMKAIRIVLYKGESEDLNDCRKLAEFTITGLPPGLPAGTAVNVLLGYDQSGILTGKATLADTGKSVDIVYDRGKKLDQ